MQHSLEARTVAVDPVEPPRGAMIPWTVRLEGGRIPRARNEYRELCACIKFQLSPRGQTRRGWFQPSKLKVQGAASRPTTLEVTTTTIRHRPGGRARVHRVSSRLPLHQFNCRFSAREARRPSYLCKQVKLSYNTSYSAR